MLLEECNRKPTSIAISSCSTLGTSAVRGRPTFGADMSGDPKCHASRNARIPASSAMACDAQVLIYLNTNASSLYSVRQLSNMKESTIDVLIIGAGPAGCMLAACLARIAPELRVRIVDKAAERVRYGHADGFQVRTVEVFQSLGIAHHVVHEGNEVAGRWSGWAAGMAALMWTEGRVRVLQSQPGHERRRTGRDPSDI